MKKINQYFSFLDRFIVSTLKAFPNHAYTRLVYKITRIESPLWLKNSILKILVFIYRIDLSTAVETKVENYKNFSELFTRKFKDKMRIIDESQNSVISPVDGIVSELGLILNKSILQAKSKQYSLKQLLKDPQLAQKYQDGFFITLYLAPSNYHRVHFPVHCQVESMGYIPGSLLSVNQFTQKRVDDLFVNQERAVINLKINPANQTEETNATQQTDENNPIENKTSNEIPMSLVMVGAMGVGSINTVWHGAVTPPYGSKKNIFYPHGKIMNFKKGDELGFFNLGSTVILLFPKNAIKLDAGIKQGSKVKMGQLIAHLDDGKQKIKKTPYQQSKEKKQKELSKT